MNGLPSSYSTNHDPDEYRISNSNDWKYEMRREAQEIIPQLLLGPFQASINLEKMKAAGITHVLCVRDKKEARLIYPRFPDQFVCETLDISDTIDQNVITVFPRCRAFIDDALTAGGTVLVHCNGGISLSPVIVVGYLMWKCGWMYEHALAYVQSKRYCVSPASFTVQLKEYEPIIFAQRAMQSSASSSAGGRGTKREVLWGDNDVDEATYERKYALPASDS